MLPSFPLYVSKVYRVLLIFSLLLLGGELWNCRSLIYVFLWSIHWVYFAIWMYFHIKMLNLNFLKKILLCNKYQTSYCLHFKLQITKLFYKGPGLLKDRSWVTLLWFVSFSKEWWQNSQTSKMIGLNYKTTKLVAVHIWILSEGKYLRNETSKSCQYKPKITVANVWWFNK